ncbi:hypothetical protein JHK82_048992 [Glycine max]|uniref:Uncharacterized protein n=2 Tax=Glycine subgen. Soja TaxID=1462606 RepID=A0A0R0F5J7_SOYBN|nr:hypothetical protein JHK86_048845 [Glycine max]RZB50029.1 hypothetical protein D0Y65_047129 [Glycine soja]KAG4934680.1 hypothetical protein JHK85_049599 [Glycine max]KAG5090214.1 hypothetical protein JHK82_048992 [Glycine max]KAG5093290.1 hypothetical protein JHK84_048878 [Glycine max]
MYQTKNLVKNTTLVGISGYLFLAHKIVKTLLLRVGFEPTPFRTRTLIWRLRPTRPSQHFAQINQIV